MANTGKFEKGAIVAWSSQAGGTERLKIGEVVEVVPKRADPKTKLSEMGFARDHVSYVVRARAVRADKLSSPKNYWPAVRNLRAATDEERAMWQAAGRKARAT